MKIINRGLWTVIGLLLGFAAGVRLLAAMSQAFDKPISIAASWCASIICGIAGGVFAPALSKSVSKHILKNKLINAVILAAAVAVCFRAQYLCLDFQIKGYPYALSFAERIMALAGTAAVLWIAGMYFIKAVMTVFAYNKIKRLLCHITKYDIIFAVSVFLVLNALMLLFCLNNKTICFWDNAGFWLTARDLAKEFGDSGIISVIRSVFGSVFTTDYNFIIAVPQMILVLLFGEARMVYIMGITNLYMYPLLMLIYVFARSRVKHPYVSAACAILSLPMVFYITKEGYIDVGAIIFAMLALILWVRRTEDKSVERYIIIGISLVLSMLLRRWLVFFVISYLIALAFDCIVYKKSAVPLFACAASIGVFLVSLFQPYITLKLMANYRDMYSAYNQGLIQDFLNVSHYFGILVLLAALVSAAVFIISKKTRQEALFMVIQLVSCFIVFVQIQTHGEQHLLLYIPSLSGILCMMYGKLWEQRGRGVISAAAVSGILTVTSVLGVTVRTDNIDTQRITLIPRFSCMPAVRYDADRVIELIRWLDKNAGEQGKTAAVAASSMVFNREILCNAEASLNQERVSDADRDEYLLWLPQVDSRDGAPYAIFDADYVVAAEPVQLHLGEENQKCVQIPAESFINGTDIANAYRKLDMEFDLGWDGSVHVSIYEKTRPISEEEKEQFIERLNEAGLNG